MTTTDLADPAIEPHDTILRSCQRAQWEGALKQLHNGDTLTIR